MNSIVNELADILCLDHDIVELMLVHFNWNKDTLLEAYGENPGKALVDSGVDKCDGKDISRLMPASESKSSITEIMCNICFCTNNVRLKNIINRSLLSLILK
jgi:hypothetical protein